MSSPPARLRARKQKGEWAESRFLSRALALGLVVSKPWGESARYDLIVEGRNGIRRVQVKSVWCRDRNRHRYHLCVSHGMGRRRRYSPREVDLIAAYVAPKDLWYLIPVRSLGPRTYIGVLPDKPRSSSPFERYREAWHLLI